MTAFHSRVMATAVDADIGPLCDKMQWPLLSWDAMEASDFDIVKKVCNKVTLTRSPITIESSPQRAGYHLPGKAPGVPGHVTYPTIGSRAETVCGIGINFRRHPPANPESGPFLIEGFIAGSSLHQHSCIEPFFTCFRHIIPERSSV